jgi:hypothetical protein
LSGRAGVADLVRRSVRWRVSVRWYLIAPLPVPVGATLISLAIYGPGALAAPAGGWPRAFAEVAAVFVLQLVLFQLAEKIGFTGFLQHHWQDRYNPLKLTLYVALLWAVWHVPDHFAEEGWGMEALISAPVVFAIGFVSLFFARALFVWFYNRTLSRRRATYHASLGRFRRTGPDANSAYRKSVYGIGSATCGRAHGGSSTRFESEQPRAAISSERFCSSAWMTS